VLHLALASGIIPLVIQYSIQVLQAQGYKVTKPRRQVLEVLEGTQKPVSPYDIQGLLGEQGEYLNHVTIYRVLDLLCGLNLAHKVLSTGGFVGCTLGKGGGCHRFVVCRQCGAIEEFADEELCHEEGKFAESLGFHTEFHLSESCGLCSECYEKQVEQDSTG
jgi:Fur family zinc uptake transcriptional regulator